MAWHLFNFAIATPQFLKHSERQNKLDIYSRLEQS